MKRIAFLLKIILILTVVVLLQAQYLHASQDLVHVNGAIDISDRAYEPAVIGLLDGAKESIVISMFIISITENERGPVKFLLRDLLEARKRGVEVTLNLNTKAFQGANKKGTEKLIGSPAFKELKKAGCKIHLMSPYRMLHDKLIIVDGRYIVEGSTNWSTSALKTNLESATLIDSPELARVKLARVEVFLKEPPYVEEGPREARYLEGLPDEITLSNALLLDKGYLQFMVTKHDEGGLDLYLLLLAQSQLTGKKELYIDIEDMGLSLGMSDKWEDSQIRQQVILILRRLKNRYKLILTEFYRDKDAWIEILDIKGEGFKVPSLLARPDNDMSLSAKFILIIKSYLEAQGEDISTMSGRTIARRFGVAHTTINPALKELKERGMMGGE